MSVTGSPAFLSLWGATRRELEATMRRGTVPDPHALVGREFRGANTMPLTRPLGIQTFVKGFDRAPDGSPRGYNRQAPASERRFGYYAVDAVDPESADNLYLNAVLLDYGRGGNPRLDPSRLLRDYVVRVDPDSDALLLGKAYAALGGSLRLPISFFVLEPL